MAINRAFIIKQLEEQGIKPQITVKFLDSLENELKGEVCKLKLPSITRQILRCVALAVESSKTVKILDLSGILSPVESKDAEWMLERVKIIAQMIKNNRSIEHLILNRSWIPKGGVKILKDALRLSSIVWLSLNNSSFEEDDGLENLKEILKTKTLLIDSGKEGGKTNAVDTLRLPELKSSDNGLFIFGSFAVADKTAPLKEEPRPNRAAVAPNSHLT